VVPVEDVGEPGVESDNEMDDPVDVDSDAIQNSSVEEGEESDGDIEEWSDQSDLENITFLGFPSGNETNADETDEDTVLAEPDEPETSDPETSTSEFVTPVESPTQFNAESPTQFDADSLDEDSLDEEETVERPQSDSRSRYGRIRRGVDRLNYDKKGGNPKIRRYSSTVLMNVNEKK
jgi:hypothetical protein